MRIVIYSLLLLLPVAANAQQHQFLLKGKIGRYNAPAKVYLRYSIDKTPRIDSVILKNGNFTFKGKIDEPVPASLFLSISGRPIKWPYDELMFYIDTGTVHIVSKDSMRDAITSGSAINQDLQAYNKMMDPIHEKLLELQDVPDGTRQGPLSERKRDSVRAVLQQRSAILNREFILKYPASPISLNALRYLSNDAGSAGAFDSLLHLFEGLNEPLKNGKHGQKLFQSLHKKRVLLTGMIAPDFSQPDSNGVAVSLYSTRGKYVLVDFWASWCKPCRQDNKELVKAYATFRDKNFIILGVSVDQRRDAWLKAVKDDQLPWQQLCDLKRDNDAAILYEITGVPTSYLLDPSGKIIAKNIHGKDLIGLLKELLP